VPVQSTQAHTGTTQARRWGSYSEPISHSCIWCGRKLWSKNSKQGPNISNETWNTSHFRGNVISLMLKRNRTESNILQETIKRIKEELRTWLKDQRPSSIKLLQWGGICPNITSNASSHLEQDEDEFLIKMLIHSHKYYQWYVSSQRQPQNKVSNTCVNTLCTAAVLQMSLNKQWLVIWRKRCNAHNSVHCLHAVPRPLLGHLNGALT